MKRFSAISLLLALGLLARLPAQGQALATRVLWERAVPLPGTASQSAYVRLFSYQGGLLAVGSLLGNSQPALLHAYTSTGQVRWQATSRKLVWWLKMVQPWARPAGGLLLVGGHDDPQAPTNSWQTTPFLQWYNGRGDSLRAILIPRTQVLSIPEAVLADSAGCYIAGSGADLNAGPGANLINYFTLTRTDTLGRVQWSRAYPNPAPGGGATERDLVRTPRGGFLLIGEGQDPLDVSHGVPYLVETDALGQPRRATLRPLFARGTNTYLSAGLNGKTCILRDGSGWVVGGFIDSLNTSSSGAARRSWGFVTRLDTALNVVWTQRLPARRGSHLVPLHVYEDGAGRLQVACNDGGNRATPYAYVLGLSTTTGALLGTQEYQFAGFAWTSLIDWQPQSDSSIVVVGQALRSASPTPRGAEAWIGRYKLGRPLATAAPVVPGGLQVWPSPAVPGAPVGVTLPGGAGPGTLHVADALGRVVRRQPVGTSQAVASGFDLPTSGLPPGLYWLRFVPDRPAVPPATARLVLAN
ncbi:hypothetical protein ACFST9_21140 [Hymenobacter monticola]|uniref:T9SS C-terminal target domain-containing protein n=1 Tax=Hymenobacter monticola TaxID=1705399 RepID=A0ABY4B9N5_9BACT|nr:hypothetical protein [Hymenobacter monticola]UOE34396.1 hypothetical protein MTP16_01770 [Hymenobacter monticola]